MTRTDRWIRAVPWKHAAGAALILIGGAALWMYVESRTLHALHAQQAMTWNSIEQSFRERTETLLAIRAIIKKEAPYETAIISELAYARVMMESASNRAAQIQAYNATELTRASLPVFVYNVERLTTHPALRRLTEQLTGLTTRLDAERVAYNQAVRAYNASLSTFPNTLTAFVLQIEPLPIFRLRGE